jgi:hypothetical protein
MDIIARLNSLSRKLAEAEDESDTMKGDKSKPNAMMIKFIEEMGDREVRNPNPNGRKDRIKLKSLQNSEYGKNEFDRYFSTWAEAQKRKNKEKPETKEKSEKKD